MSNSVYRTLRQTLSDMRRGAHMAPKQGWQLAARDIRIEYVHTKLGLFWAFIEPLAIALVFIALRRNGVLDINGLNMPFSLFAVCGILVWQTFFDSMMVSLSSLQRASALIGNYAVPPESLVAAMIYRSLFLLTMRLPIVLGLTAALGLFDWQGATVFTLLSPIAAITGVAVGLFFAPFTLVSGDLKLAVGVVARPMLYLSGAIFPLVGGLEIFLHLNPVAIIIDNLRYYLINAQFSDLPALLYVATGAGILLLLAWFAFHRTMRVFV